MTQAELAVAARTARSYISDVERGVIGCSVGWVYEIASVLGIRPAELLPDDPSLPSPRTPAEPAIVEPPTTMKGKDADAIGP